MYFWLTLFRRMIDTNVNSQLTINLSGMATIGLAQLVKGHFLRAIGLRHKQKSSLGIPKFFRKAADSHGSLLTRL